MRPRLVVVLACFGLLTGVAHAGPIQPCPQGKSAQTLDWYLVQQSCAIGDLTVKGFSYSNTGVTIPASEILVEPFVGPQGPRLRFSSDAFFVGAGQRAVLDLIYNIDPPPIIIRGFDEEMFTETPVAPGFVTIDTWLCVGGAFPGSCGGGGPAGTVLLYLHLAHYGPGDLHNELIDSAWFPLAPPYTLGVSHSITLDATTGGDASFSALDNQAYTVPEPASLLLLGTGLVGLTRAWRKRRG